MVTIINASSDIAKSFEKADERGKISFNICKISNICHIFDR